MVGKKVYLQPRSTVLESVNDIVELLRGKSTVGDTANGKIGTRLSMYGLQWEVRFTVADLGRNRSRVAIEITGERNDKKKEILSMFALLDSMLVAAAEIEFEDDYGELRGTL